MKVVIADDSAAVRQRLAARLCGTRGITSIGEARDGVEALDLVRSLEPDAVILDVRMPRLSGRDVLRALRRRRRRCLVIVLTSYDHPAYRRGCRELGARYFLDKFREFDRVAEIIEATAEGGRAARSPPRGAGR